MLKYFGIPFANAGGKVAVPAADPGTGAVSYATGWGPYYQLAKTDPNCLNVDRQQTNQMFYDVTAEIKLLQEHGVPDFITTALNGGTAHEYGIGDIVRYLGAVYVSRVAANVDLPSVAASWSLVRFAGIPKAVAGGTADVVTANFSPDLGTLLDGDQILIQHGGANTGAVTINPDGAGAVSVYKGANAALVAGDIPGANFWGLYVYDASLNKLQMLNPAFPSPTGINQGYASAALNLTAGASFTMAHGLTTIPKLTEFEITMVSAVNGYSIGAKFFTPSYFSRPDGTPVGFSVSVDATNISIRVASTSTLACINNSSGAPANLNYPDFTLTVRAYA